MKRIVIIGTSGSGKTTLAKKLSKKLDIPFYDLDDYYWLPNWQPRNLENFQSQVSGIIKQAQWVISGNYSNVRRDIWEKADCIVWLNYNFIRCLYQAASRSLQRILNKELCCNGNQESFGRTFFSKQSLLLWIIKSHWRYQREYSELFRSKEFANKKFLMFLRPKTVEQWLTNL